MRDVDGGTAGGYLDEDALVLVEEPENGIHPQVLEAVVEALAASRRTQVIVATHSPVLLGVVSRQDLVCFLSEEGRTRVVEGNGYPALNDWKDDVDIGTLFAAGVLA